MRKHGAAPVPATLLQRDGAPLLQRDEAQLLVTLTRTVLGVRAGNGTLDDFQRQIARLALEGVDVGDKFHTHQFMREATFVAARCVEALELEEFQMPLAGLGTRSDFAALFDG